MIILNKMSGKAMKYFFITVRKHQVKDHVDQWDLDYINTCLWAYHDVEHIDGACEMDSTYKQLHYHGIIGVPKRWRYNGLTSLNGYRVWYKSITRADFPRIKHYIHKNWDQCHIQCNDYYEYAF